MNILVFGAGINGKRYVTYTHYYEQDKTIIAFVDNNADLWNTNITIEGRCYEIQSPTNIKNIEFDQVMVTNRSAKQINDIKEQLKQIGVEERKIHIFIDDIELKTKVYVTGPNAYAEETDARVVWLNDFARYAHDLDLAGNVAECGVFRGYFSYYINKYFPEKSLYLFDTFEGFTDDDVDMELALGNPSYNNSVFAQKKLFSETSVEMVKHRMLHVDKCIIKKGYFPNTTAGIDDQFCFVNLDMDLYTPMLAALEYFSPRMVKGGVMLLHDYFASELPGVKQAVEDYEAKTSWQLAKMPIGDHCSLAILKG